MIKRILKALLSHCNVFREFWDELYHAFKLFFPVFMIVLIPLVYPLLISLTYSNQTVVERYVVVMDEDNSQLSRDFMFQIDATQGAQITRRVTTIDEGFEAVLSRDADAFVLIPADFSKRIARMEQANVKTYVYAANMMIYASVMTAIQETTLGVNNQLALERITTPKGIKADRAQAIVEPIAYDKTVLYAPTLAYSSFLCPVLFVLVIQQMTLIVPGVGVGMRRENDKKFRKKRMWFIEYLARFLVYVPFVCLGIWFIYTFVVPMFGWPTGSFADMFKIALIMCVLHAPISIILMSLTKDRYTTFQIILATSVPAFMISGYIWPSYSMPGWVASIGEWFLINPGSHIIRKVVFKGFAFEDCIPELAQMFNIFFWYVIAALIVVHRGIVLHLIRFLRGKTDEDAELGTQNASVEGDPVDEKAQPEPVDEKAQPEPAAEAAKA